MTIEERPLIFYPTITPTTVIHTYVRSKNAMYLISYSFFRILYVCRNYFNVGKIRNIIYEILLIYTYVGNNEQGSIILIL